MIDWLIAQKKKLLKLWRLPKNRRFYGNMECLLLLWPRYIGKKGRTLGKTYRIELWEHWEPREHIENLMGIH
jgi:hypothetical protein